MKACLLLALIALIAVSSVARAQPAEQPVFVVTVDSGSSGVDADAVRSAIGRELEARVETAPNSSARGTIDVRVKDTSITVVYVDRGGQKLERTIDRPKDPSQDVEVIALLAGNLARDEARELAEGLAPKPAPAPADTETPPPAKPAAPKPSAKPAAKPAPKPAAKQPAPTTRDEPSKTEQLVDALQEGAVNVSLFHPIALFPDSHERTVRLELGLVYGRVGAIEGVGFNSGVLRTEHLLRGAALSGIWTWSLGDTEGAVISGLFSTSAGRLRGAEMAALFHLRQGDVEGFQTAVAFNTAGALDGAQIAVGFNHAERMNGGQIAVGPNIAGDIVGGQIAIVNVGGNIDGAQIGLVNVAGRVRGAQVGLVNVADRVDGVSFAPISVLAENDTHLQLWSDTTLIANGGLKYSTGPLYTLGTVGGDPAPKDQRKLGAGAGIGAHLWTGGEFSLDVDVIYRVLLQNGSEEHSTAYRLVGGFQLSSLSQLFAAAGVEHRVENDEHVGYPHGAVGVQLF